MEEENKEEGTKKGKILSKVVKATIFGGAGVGLSAVIIKLFKSLKNRKK